VLNSQAVVGIVIVIYKVAMLSEPELQVAIKEGVISPKMLRSDLEAWLEKRAGKVPASDSPHAKVIATVQVPPDYDAKKQALLEKALDKLRAQFGFSLERPRDLEEMAFNRMALRVDDHIRKSAKRFIASLKTSRVQAAGKVSAGERKKLWPFSDDEIAILPEATWEQVKATLELVGNGDEFERLRDEALRLYGVPEERVSDHPIIDHDEAMAEIRSVMQEARRSRGNGQPMLQRRKRTDRLMNGPLSLHHSAVHFLTRLCNRRNLSSLISIFSRKLSASYIQHHALGFLDIA
jgi:hypothetical protein